MLGPLATKPGLGDEEGGWVVVNLVGESKNATVEKSDKDSEHEKGTLTETQKVGNSDMKVKLLWAESMLQGRRD